MKKILLFVTLLTIVAFPQEHRFKGNVKVNKLEATAVNAQKITADSVLSLHLVGVDTSYAGLDSIQVYNAIALKADKNSPTFTGTVVLPSTTSIGNVSSTELGYLDNVTGSIQTQLNAKASMVITDSLAEDITNTVDKTTTQTITGQKTFYGMKINNSIIYNSSSNANYIDFYGGGGGIKLGKEGSTNQLFQYSTPYNGVMGTSNATGLEFFVNTSKVLSLGAAPYNPGASSNYSTFYGKLVVTDSVGVRKKLDVDGTVTIGAYTLPNTDGTANQVLKTNGSGILSWQPDLTTGGGTYYADSVVIGGRYITTDSLRTIDQLKATYVPLTNNGYQWLISDWLDYSSSTVFKLGKSYNTKRFNNGAYSDVWNIDYVIPPYNLSANWLFPIEHRTDYYNDTLQTISNVANLLYIDGTGTLLWKTNDVNISGVETQVNVGDLPDSTTLTWANTGLFGNNVILNEANLTATQKRFPMKVKGYSFDIGTNNYYTYPELYSYYSDLSTGNLEKAYHFYGKGDYPSYFGGNILTDGYIKVQDSIIIGSSTVKIFPDSITIGGTRVAKINEAVGLSQSQVNTLIATYVDTAGSTSKYTATQIDSAITIAYAFRNGTATEVTQPNGLDVITAINNETGNLETIRLQNLSTSTTFSNVAGLQDTINALHNQIAYLVSLIQGLKLTDNTPTLPPTNLVATAKSTTKDSVYWTDPTAPDLDSIRIYRGSANDTTTLAYIGRVAKGVGYYLDTGRSPNTIYWYGTKAVDDSGNVSYWSNRDSAKTFAESGVTPLATLDFEEGNLSEWSSTSGANLSASTTFAHGGTYSMRVGTNSYGFFNFTSDTEVWLTFWIYLPSTSSQNATTNYVAMFDNGIADRSCFGTNNGTWSEWIVGVNSGDLTDGDFTTNFSQDTWHKVKIYYQTNGTTTSNHQWWVDDTSIYSTTNIFTNSVSLFTVGSEAATITNYFYVDDIKLYDQDPGTQD